MVHAHPWSAPVAQAAASHCRIDGIRPLPRRQITFEPSKCQSREPGRASRTPQSRFRRKAKQWARLPFHAIIAVVNPKMRDSVPFPASGSLPRLLQALYQRFLRRLFLGFTTRVHYLNSCKNRSGGSLPRFLHDAQHRRPNPWRRVSPTPRRTLTARIHAKEAPRGLPSSGIFERTANLQTHRSDGVPSHARRTPIVKRSRPRPRPRAVPQPRRPQSHRAEGRQAGPPQSRRRRKQERATDRWAGGRAPSRHSPRQPH